MSSRESEKKLPDELTALEAALRGLQPPAARIDRDRLMYLAGQASVSPNVKKPVAWGWPLVTAASLLLALSFGVQLVHLSKSGDRSTIARTGSNPPSDQLASLPIGVAVAARPSASADEFTYLQLRNTVLDHGVDALRESNTTNSKSMREKAFPLWPSLGGRSFDNS
jgi:hypothetical protein